MNEQQEREAFERHFRRWIDRKGRSLTFTVNGEYADYRVQARWLGWEARAALTPESTATSEDAQDAARYRWLRENGEPDEGMAYRSDWRPSMYDQAIDAAMKEAKK